MGGTVTDFLSSCLPQSENASEEAGEGEYVNLYSSGQSNGELPRSEGVSNSPERPAGAAWCMQSSHRGSRAWHRPLLHTLELPVPSSPAIPLLAHCWLQVWGPSWCRCRAGDAFGVTPRPGRSQGWLLLLCCLLCASLAVWSCLREVPFQTAAPSAILGPHLFL